VKSLAPRGARPWLAWNPNPDSASSKLTPQAYVCTDLRR
jgi:hypothetical protein